VKESQIKSAATAGDAMWSLFRQFVAADTSVLPGETQVSADDVRVASFARDVAAPALHALGGTVEVDDLNNVIARFGGTRRCALAIVSYSVTHHGNRMSDPLRARRGTIAGESCWIGLGASQGKAGLAAACEAVRLASTNGARFDGGLVLAVSSEGRSTHDSARALYRALDPLPGAVVMTIGTENRLMLGNRGRVDVRIDIPGRATHSSAPSLGDNPIPRVADVLGRLSSVPLDRSRHPELGARHLEPYSLVCGPIAPHTIPERCRLTLDRRLLPGDSPEAAVADVARALEGLAVEVAMGPLMLPALTPSGDPRVSKLKRAAEAALGRGLEPAYPAWTFDAGYPASLGIPTIMFGPSSEGATGTEVLDDDYVSERMVVEAAAVYAAMIGTEP